MTILDEISMMLITFAGSAKALSIQMIDEAESGKDTTETLKEIEENLKLAGEQHFKILQMSATEEIKPTVLFLHAEDQMMNAETIFIMAKKLVAIHGKINEK